jgi:acetolactate synthase-1/2/3 large subunit
MSEQITAGRAVVDALVAAGVDHAFCVPGESFMGVLDALYDEPRIRVVAARHEGGAAFMAEAYAKLARRPAVCMATRMVGGANLAIGIHTARQDSTPVIALLGQVTTAFRYREGFQEAELADAFTRIAKWTVEPPDAVRCGELTLRAAREAVSGRPGPVVVALREDLLNEKVDRVRYARLEVARPAPDPDAIARIVALLSTAERPLILVGGGVLASGATEAVVRLADALSIPVMTSLRRADAFPNDHPLYLGQTGLWAPPSVQRRLRETDVLIALGTRLGEAATVDFAFPAAQTRLVHVDIAAEQLGGHRVVPDVGCVADARLFAEALAVAGISLDAARRARWKEQACTDHETIDRETTPSERGKARPAYIDQQTVAWHLRRLLPRDAVIASDAGNFGGWPTRFLRWTEPGTFVAPTSGAMGYGVPAAIAAKLAFPERLVVATIGDGGMLMTGTELETAVRERTPFIALVFDNSLYGTIRLVQEREHPGRQVATALGDVDFVAFARSLGAMGVAVRDAGEFPAAFEEARRANVPAVLHLRTDPQQLSVNADAG